LYTGIVFHIVETFHQNKIEIRLCLLKNLIKAKKGKKTNRSILYVEYKIPITDGLVGDNTNSVGCDRV
jgi:hypothetical protein